MTSRSVFASPFFLYEGIMVDTPPNSQPLVTITVKPCPAPEFKGLTYPRLQSLLTDGEPEDAHKDRLVVGILMG